MPQRPVDSPKTRRIRCFLPGFRVSCLSVGGLYVLLAGGILLRGIPASLQPYGIPAPLLASPHYLDAMVWVYSHMLVIGLIIALVGHFGLNGRLPRAFARLMLAAHLYYTWLDFRASDSPLGNGLYRGPASLLPAIISLLICWVFLHLSLCPVHGCESSDQPEQA